MKVTKDQLRIMIKEALLKEEISDSFEFDGYLINWANEMVNGDASAASILHNIKEELSFNKNLVKKLKPATKRSFANIVKLLKVVAKAEASVRKALTTEIGIVESRSSSEDDDNPSVYSSDNARRSAKKRRR